MFRESFVLEDEKIFRQFCNFDLLLMDNHSFTSSKPLGSFVLLD